MERVYLRQSFERPLLMTNFGLFGMDDITCSGRGTQKTAQSVVGRRWERLNLRQASHHGPRRQRRREPRQRRGYYALTSSTPTLCRLPFFPPHGLSPPFAPTLALPNLPANLLSTEATIRVSPSFPWPYRPSPTRGAHISEDDHRTRCAHR